MTDQQARPATQAKHPGVRVVTPRNPDQEHEAAMSRQAEPLQLAAHGLSGRKSAGPKSAGPKADKID